MERVETLAEKLKEQIAKGAKTSELLLTVHMLQSELLHLQSIQPEETQKETVAIDIPVLMPTEGEVNEPELSTEKVVMELQLDEDAVAAELSKIKADADSRMVAGVKNRPTVLFDFMEDIPTLSQQQSTKSAELKLANATASDTINDALAETPIKDLKKAIGINERYMYINELFNGEEVAFDRSIKTINGFGAYGEADLWIRRELIHTYGWDDKSATVKQFYQLVRRRFSTM